MSSWSSWLSEKASEVSKELGEGLRDFSSQLADDTEEVAAKTRETVSVANAQIAESLERGVDTTMRLTEALIDTSTVQADSDRVRRSQCPVLPACCALGARSPLRLACTAQLREKIESIDTARLAEQARASANASVSALAGALTQAEESASGLISRVRGGEGSGASAASAAAAGANSANRHEERVRNMQGDESTYLGSPSDVMGFEQWCGGFELLSYTQRIEALLRDTDTLRAMHSALVPDKVSYRTFWQRYFYHLEVLEQQERKRVALLRKAAPQADSFGWDDDNWDVAPARPARTIGRTASSSTGAPRPVVKTGPAPVKRLAPLPVVAATAAASKDKDKVKNPPPAAATAAAAAAAGSASDTPTSTPTKAAPTPAATAPAEVDASTPPAAAAAADAASSYVPSPWPTTPDAAADSPGGGGTSPAAAPPTVAAISSISEEVEDEAHAASPPDAAGASSASGVDSTEALAAPPAAAPPGVIKRPCHPGQLPKHKCHPPGSSASSASEEFSCIGSEGTGVCVGSDAGSEEASVIGTEEGAAPTPTPTAGAAGAKPGGDDDEDWGDWE